MKDWDALASLRFGPFWCKMTLDRWWLTVGWIRSKPNYMEQPTGMRCDDYRKLMHVVGHKKMG